MINDNKKDENRTTNQRTIQRMEIDEEEMMTTWTNFRKKLKKGN